MAQTAKYRKKTARAGRAAGKKKAGRAGRSFSERDLRRLRELGGLALAAAGCYLALVLYLGWSGGLTGQWSQELFRYLFGVLIYLTPLAMIAGGALLIFPEAPLGPLGLRVGLALLICALFLATGANTFSILGSQPAHTAYFASGYFSAHGGLVGDALYWVTGSLTGDVGSTVATVFLLLASAFLITGASVRTVLVASGLRAGRAAAGARRTTQQLGQNLAERRAAALEQAAPGAGGAAAAMDGPAAKGTPFGAEPVAGRRPAVGEVLAAHGGGNPMDGAETFPDIFQAGGTALAVAEAPAQPAAATATKAVDAPDDASRRTGLKPVAGDAVQGELFPKTRHEQETGYIVPNADLLRKSGEQEISAKGSERISNVLTETLASFGIEARVIGMESGPRVTRYELQLGPGIKVSRISNLKNDIAYALATTDIRILAPIPGKSAVGVEVPNTSPNLVTLGDIYRDFPAGGGPLMVWLGKDIAGKPVYTDLAQMPHLLVAGTTGSGKSGCINCLISSILLRSTPDQVNMILIDPKRVELNHFEGIPHLLTPVVTVMKDAANVLANLVQEMESRYGQMQLVKARQLDELNKVRLKRGQKQLPYVLLVVDELADLMMVAPGEVEDAIIRLAQKSRAVGIHLVLATQRPSVDVITGMIKANVPSRIAFAVSSQIDSRVILDTAGAESLLGQGDMLFRPLGSSQLKRIQGAYISEEEIKLLTDRCRSQQTPDFNFDLLEGKQADGEEALPADEDGLLPEAMELVVSTGTASVSFLQRRLRVGYTRAGRLIDMLEKRGVISGYEGSKPRRVLMNEEALRHLLAGGQGQRDTAARAAEEDERGLDGEGGAPGAGPDWGDHDNEEDL